MRLRRLCFEIFALRLFFREPITNLRSAVADPTTEQARFQLTSCDKQPVSETNATSSGRYSVNKDHSPERSLGLRCLTEITRKTVRVEFTWNLHLRRSAWLESPLKERFRRQLVQEHVTSCLETFTAPRIGREFGRILWIYELS